MCKSKQFHLRMSAISACLNRQVADYVWGQVVGIFEKDISQSVYFESYHAV